jgi:hypothetical protein
MIEIGPNLAGALETLAGTLAVVVFMWGLTRRGALRLYGSDCHRLCHLPRCKKLAIVIHMAGVVDITCT